MSELNDRQKLAWPRFISELQRRSEYLIPDDPWHWDITFREETRPGRGHDIVATYLDGEIVASITMDVYGGGYHALGFTEWVHNSADDECECNVCFAERDDD